MLSSRPRLLITLGDVAGIGPEIVARAWPDLLPLCRPAIVGDPLWVRRGLELIGSPARVHVVAHPNEAKPSVDVLPCLCGSEQDLSRIEPGQVCAAAGRAAYDFLCRAIDWTLAGDADGIVTAPLHKEGLHAAGLSYPGHTEILAERTGVKEFAMVLAVGNLAVAHVTLHMALRDVFRHLTPAAVLEKTHLLDGLLTRLLGRRPRLGVAALNPHASDGGLFGDEEATIIAPAVQAARKQGLDASGPWPCDTLFVRGASWRVRWHRGHVSRSGAYRAEAAWRGTCGQHQRRSADRSHQRGPRYRLRHCRPRHRRPLQSRRGSARRCVAGATGG